MSIEAERARSERGMEAAGRRKFLYFATASFGIIGVAFAVWPLIGQMQPADDVRALDVNDVDLSELSPGQMIQVMRRGQPIFIRRLTSSEIDNAEPVRVSDLNDPFARNANLPAGFTASRDNRLSGPSIGDGDRAEYLIVRGVCTHVGCVVILGQENDHTWTCPCCGSRYDAFGRVRVGPAPQNLAVPLIQRLSGGRVRIA